MTYKNEWLNKANRIIGNRIYTLRIAKGISRKELGEFAGVTPQQIQKYETGTDRTSTGRIFLIAKALTTEISYFFKDLDSAEDEKMITQHQCMGVEVSRNFMKIKNSSCQEAIHNLIKVLSKNQ